MSNAELKHYSKAQRFGAAATGTTTALAIGVAAVTLLEREGLVKLVVACLLPLPLLLWRWPQAIFESKLATVAIAAAVVVSIAAGFKLTGSAREEPAPSQSGSNMGTLFEKETMQAVQDKVDASWQASSSAASGAARRK